jgi:copper chaperone CopZ
MIRMIALLTGLLMFTPLSWAGKPQVVDIEVTGMTCPFCVYGTEKKLNKLPGVDTATVSLKNKQARIVMTPGENADLDAIHKAIVDAGFTPGETTVHATGTAK